MRASDNDNGWTDGKMGAARPLTVGPDEMGGLKEIVLEAKSKTKEGGAYQFRPGFAQRYMDDLARRPKLKRKLKVIAACGNGTARAKRVQLRSVRVGAIQIENVEAMVLDEGMLGQNLLGMSFLKRLARFEIRKGVLELER